jgi:hypothetical protein
MVIYRPISWIWFWKKVSYSELSTVNAVEELYEIVSARQRDEPLEQLEKGGDGFSEEVRMKNEEGRSKKEEVRLVSQRI